MSADDLYMKRACEIAFTRMGKTSPNPAVGAVIVKNNNIIGEGGTGIYGGDHAEVAAIKDACNRGNDTSGASIYVSLEPCSHYGKTPPCTEAVIKSGIRKVFTPLLDPNPLVSGNGIRCLADAGIEIKIMHKHFHAASDLIRGFKKFILRNSPYIINKCAETLDGKIASSSGDSKWISNVYTRLFVHKLRAKVDAVIIGKNTYMKDNPMLNVRFDEFEIDVKKFLSGCSMNMSGRENFFLEKLLKDDIIDYKDPLRVMIGIPEIVSSRTNFFRDDNYIVIADKKKYNNAVSANPELKSLYGKMNIALGSFYNNEEEMHFIMDHLKSRGIMTALLEGGGTLNGSFYNAGEIDQFLYVIAPKVLGSGISPVQGKASEKISDSLILRDISAIMIDDNILFNGYKEEYNFEMM